MLKRSVHSGFTLIELLIAITVLSILILVGLPAFQSWVANAQVRTVADGIQNGLHLAQGEATRLNRQVQFVLTDSTPSGTGPWAASATGKNWIIRRVPKAGLGDSSATELVEGSALGNVASTVNVSGPATLTFNSLGIVTDAAGATSTYQVSRAGADHPLNVTISVGGQIRACDVSKSITASPEGCS